MPKVSEKRKILKLWKEIYIHEWLTLGLSTEGTNNREREDELIEDLTILCVCAEKLRYLCPFVQNSVPKSRKFVTEVLPNLHENRFREIVRVDWCSFQYILSLIRTDDVFNGPRSCKQFPVETQLAIVLYRLGSCGEGATSAKIAYLFGISDGGTIQTITDRVFQAILKLKNNFVYWPDAQERKTLVTETLHELPHCVGYVDGTEIKLAEKPSQDPEAYFSRKHIYSVKAQAICDHNLRIRHMVLGYPGSVHDARIYNNCELSTNTPEFLTGAEWIAGDSAYKLTSTLITPFRTNATTGTLNQRNTFNRTFSKYRIRIEHCFGLIKERFNSLKELKIQIRNDSSIKLSCHWILVCAILHNILISIKDNHFEMSADPERDLENDQPGNPTFGTIGGEERRRTLMSIMQQEGNQ